MFGYDLSYSLWILSENYFCGECHHRTKVSVNPDPLDVQCFNSLERELVDRWAEEGDSRSFRALIDDKKRRILESL
ncbi:MAG: hypothetical protein Q8R18_01660 [bacterium]|nr:hypothetical protein [bacterium]